MKLISTVTALVLLSSCLSKSNKDNRLDTVIQPAHKQVAQTDAIHFHKLGKLKVMGDFDGDGKTDTVFQHVLSGLTHKEIDSAANPFANDFDVFKNWFNQQQTDIYLTINKKQTDTLHVGSGQGLYCLINIGDNNGDGKDELAYVVDYLDESQINSCHILSLCGNKWQILKTFDVHEEAFDFTGGEHAVPTFTDIKGFLEKRNSKWVYLDYHAWMEGSNKFKPLNLGKCR